jgi:hypothetical protein
VPSGLFFEDALACCERQRGVGLIFQVAYRLARIVIPNATLEGGHSARRRIFQADGERWDIDGLAEQ